MSIGTSPPADVVALLDLTAETLDRFGPADDRRVQLRTAIDLMTRLVDAVRSVGSSGFPEGFEDRVANARHCLIMGKPLECLVMVRRLQGELQSFWTD